MGEGGGGNFSNETGYNEGESGWKGGREREREEHDRGKPSEQTNIYFRFAGCRFNKFN